MDGLDEYLQSDRERIRQGPVLEDAQNILRAIFNRIRPELEKIAAETRAMVSVAVGPTVDRSVLGIMVDFGKAIPYHLAPGRWGEATLRIVEKRLAETPCHAARSWDRVIFPEKKASEVLRAKWLASTPLQPTSSAWTTVH